MSAPFQDLVNVQVDKLFFVCDFPRSAWLLEPFWVAFPQGRDLLFSSQGPPGAPASARLSSLPTSDCCAAVITL